MESKINWLNWWETYEYAEHKVGQYLILARSPIKKYLW